MRRDHRRRGRVHASGSSLGGVPAVLHPGDRRHREADGLHVPQRGRPQPLLPAGRPLARPASTSATTTSVTCIQAMLGKLAARADVGGLQPGAGEHGGAGGDGGVRPRLRPGGFWCGARRSRSALAAGVRGGGAGCGPGQPRGRARVRAGRTALGSDGVVELDGHRRPGPAQESDACLTAVVCLKYPTSSRASGGGGARRASRRTPTRSRSSRSSASSWATCTRTSWRSRSC